MYGPFFTLLHRQRIIATQGSPGKHDAVPISRLPALVLNAPGPPMNVYQRIFEYSPGALLLIDQAGRMILANAQAETLFGYDRSELIDQPVEMLVPPRFSAQPPDGRRRRTPYPAQARQRTPGQHHAGPNDRRRRRTTPAASCTTSPSSRPHKKTAELRRLHADLELLANHDGLTGLYNRRAFLRARRTTAQNRAPRAEKRHLADARSGLFQTGQRSLRHTEDDRTLQAVATTLKAAVPKATLWHAMAARSLSRLRSG